MSHNIDSSVYLSKNDLQDITDALTNSYLTPKIHWYQRLAIGIYCSLYFNQSDEFTRWAEAWLNNVDHTLVSTLHTLTEAYKLPEDTPDRMIKINALTAILLYAPCLHDDPNITVSPFRLTNKAITMWADECAEINHAFGTPIHDSLDQYIRKALLVEYTE